jgi:hypothetical protein
MINPGGFQMTVLCDFVQIVSDVEQNIPVLPPLAEAPLPDFNTNGRIALRTALLIYSVRSFTGTAEVFINGSNVGTITPTPPGNVFSTQMIAVMGTQLNNGNNQIVVRNATDSFVIKNVNLFFHQSS